MAGELSNLNKYKSEEMNPQYDYSMDMALSDLSNERRRTRNKDTTLSSEDSEPRHRFIQSSEKDISLPLERQKAFPGYYDTPDDEISTKKYLGAAVGIVSLIAENLLSHPFVVLRRQCQVYTGSKRYHLQPFTLFPTVIHLNQSQGLTTLWKGIGSCLLVRGMSLTVEDVIHKVTSWPKEVHNQTSLKNFGQHIILKSISIAVVMPFYSASLVETVQSDIASDKPGILDVFKEGLRRLLAWNMPQKGRMLPIWVLVGPSIGIGLSKYFFSLVVKGITCRIVRRRIVHTPDKKNNRVFNEEEIKADIELYSNLVSIITSEVMFYPFETIIHRLQLQGTRTIIDNLDTGYSVVPILTKYEGFIDCYRSTLHSEGVCGLYKGFGALILQIAAHIAVIKLAKWAICHVTEAFSTKPPSKVIQYYNLDRENHSNSSTISRSLSSLDAGLVEIEELN